MCGQTPLDLECHAEKRDCLLGGEGDPWRVCEQESQI